MSLVNRRSYRCRRGLWCRQYQVGISDLEGAEGLFDGADL